MGPVDKLLSYFYTDPRPERLFGFIEQAEGLVGRENWGAYPPLVGFLAVVFSAHPDQIERLLPAMFNSKSAVAIAAALKLSGAETIIAKLQPKLKQVTWDPKLQAELAGLPARLEDIDIKTPTHLDIMWGAAFASGDSRYVLTILNFLAKELTRSNEIALDIIKVTAAMTGGPKDILKEFRGKYGDALAWEIVVASTALWALRSNALQHPFVEHVITEYAARHAAMPVKIAFSNLRSEKK